MTRSVLIRGSGRQATGLLRYFSSKGYSCSIVSKNVEALKRLKYEYNCQVYFSWHECLKYNKLFDIAIVASKPSDHLVDLKSILKFETETIILEKPLAHNIDDARKIQSILGSVKSKIYVNYPYRKQHIYTYLKNIITDDANGKLLEFDATISFPRVVNPNEYPGCWWVDKSISGGGTIYQVGIHWINFIFSLFNYDLNIIKASMLFNEFGVDDTVWGLWESRDGETMVNINLTSVAKYHNVMIKLMFNNAVYIFDNNYMYINKFSQNKEKEKYSILTRFMAKKCSTVLPMGINNLGENYLNTVLNENICDRSIINDAVNDILIYDSIVKYQATLK